MGLRGKAKPLPLATRAALAQMALPLGEQRPQGKADGWWGRGTGGPSCEPSEAKWPT